MLDTFENSQEISQRRNSHMAQWIRDTETSPQDQHRSRMMEHVENRMDEVEEENEAIDDDVEGDEGSSTCLRPDEFREIKEEFDRISQEDAETLVQDDVEPAVLRIEFNAFMEERFLAGKDSRMHNDEPSPKRSRDENVVRKGNEPDPGYLRLLTLSFSGPDPDYRRYFKKMVLAEADIISRSAHSAIMTTLFPDAQMDLTNYPTVAEFCIVIQYYYKMRLDALTRTYNMPQSADRVPFVGSTLLPKIIGDLLNSVGRKLLHNGVVLFCPQSPDTPATAAERITTRFTPVISEKWNKLIKLITLRNTTPLVELSSNIEGSSWPLLLVHRVPLPADDAIPVEDTESVTVTASFHEWTSSDALFAAIFCSPNRSHPVANVTAQMYISPPIRDLRGIRTRAVLHT